MYKILRYSFSNIYLSVYAYIAQYGEENNKEVH